MWIGIAGSVRSLEDHAAIRIFSALDRSLLTCICPEESRTDDNHWKSVLCDELPDRLHQVSEASDNIVMLSERLTTTCHLL